MTTPSALDHPGPPLRTPISTLVTVDLPAIEAYAGRVDRLAADVSLARSFAATHGEVHRSYSGEILGWGSSEADEVLAHVDGILHRVAVATRDIAERLRDSRDTYAHAVGDSGSAVDEIWAPNDSAGFDERPTGLADGLALGLTRELDGLAAQCGRWATTLADGLSALTLSWTDQAATRCAAYVCAVVELINSAGTELLELGAAGGTDHAVAA